MHHPLGGVLGYLRRLDPDDAGPEPGDGALLARFLAGDQSAFALLVGRHAPLVWGVCRRLLGPSPDAEDAFQATFIVLVRKASGLTDDRPLGPWLHRVASRTAAKARARSVRQQSRETNVVFEAAAEDPADLQRREIGTLLEEEVGRLPEHYRRPVVLCYLEGLTNEEAARRLDCPRGTVLSRLSRAREHLRERLARRGIDSTTLVLPGALASTPAPSALVATVAQAAPVLRTGGTLGLSASGINLANGVLFSMFLRKLEMVGLVVLVMALAATGTGWLTQSPPTLNASRAAQPAADPAAPPKGTSDTKPEKGSPKKKPTGAQEDTLIALQQVIDFPGFDDPNSTLSEVLAFLSKEYGVSFDLDERAFKAENLNDIGKTLIAETPLAPARAPLPVILGKLLSRLPLEPGATFLVRKNGILITTVKMALNEVGVPPPEHELDEGNTQQLVPLVSTRFTRVPLEKALEEVSDLTGYTIVLDGRAELKPAITINARFMNVRVDTAVRLLADMAGLTAERLDNVFYVTSPENAKKIAKEKHGAKMNIVPGGGDAKGAPQGVLGGFGGLGGGGGIGGLGGIGGGGLGKPGK